MATNNIVRCCNCWEPIIGAPILDEAQKEFCSEDCRNELVLFEADEEFDGSCDDFDDEPADIDDDFGYDPYAGTSDIFDGYGEYD